MEARRYDELSDKELYDLISDDEQNKIINEKMLKELKQMDDILQKKGGVGVHFKKRSKLIKDISDFESILDESNRIANMAHQILDERQGIGERQAPPQTHTEVESTLDPDFFELVNSDPYAIDFSSLNEAKANTALRYMAEKVAICDDSIRMLNKLNKKSLSSLTEQNIADKAKLERIVNDNIEWYKSAKDVLSRFGNPIKEESPEIIEESQPEVLKKIAN